nr:integrase, catalytic region, zinc finger, CCHC-type, peptidase aspartic, catalytic [Tanacetum cinerariifolium]
MANLSEDIQCAGSDTQPPMLDRTNFASWKQRIKLYCQGKENGVNILKSIDEGPFLMGTHKGETIHDYYVRFAKLINDMRNIKMTMSRMQLNSKFLNNMLHEWGRFVTAVKLNRGLRDSNYDQLYAYLNQHKTHAKENKMMLDRFSQHTVGPLALMSNVSQQRHYSPSSSTSASIYVPPHLADNAHLDSSLSPTDNLIENLTNTLALLTQSYKTFLPKTNNQLRTSSNTRNQATIQDGRVVVQTVQVNGIEDFALNVDNVFQADDCDVFEYDVDEAPMVQTMFMANLSYAYPVTDEAGPSYASNILSEVQDHDLYQDVVCAHHEEHAMHDNAQLNHVVDSHADYTSDSNMISYDQYVKDNAVPVVHKLEAEVAQNVVDRRHDAIERKNLLMENNNLIAECLSKGVFSVATNSELNVARFTKMHVANTIVKACCLELEAGISNLHDKSHHDNHEELVKRFSKLEVNQLNLQLKYQNLKESFGNNPPTPDKDTPDFDSVFVIDKMQASIQGKDNVIRQLKNQISHLAENDKIKQHYKELYDSIKITRAKHIEQVTSLTTENVNPKAHILDKVNSVSKDHVKTKVLAPRKYAIDVKPIVPRLRNNTKAHIDYLRNLKESVETIRDIVEEAKVVRPLDRSIVSACRYTKHSQELLEYALALVRVNRFTNASGSQSSSNTKNNKISPAKGVNKMQVEEQPKTNTSHLRTSNSVDYSSLSKRTGINLNLDFVCQTCNKCLNSANHDMCMVDYLQYVVALPSIRHNCNVVRKGILCGRTGAYLFFVRKFCDFDLEVAFRKHSCYVRDTNGVELIKGSRGSNLYTISIEDMIKSSPIYLLSKASKNKSWLWHRHLNHLNFEFVNHTLTEYYKRIDIFHQKTVPKTPQQNDVVERQNRTLVEAAQTMLIFSKALMFLWAEAVATACYTQNRSLEKRN